MKRKIVAVILSITLAIMIFSPATSMAKSFKFNLDASKYRIEVDLTNQIMTVYEDNEIVRQALCSSGMSGFSTPTGSFKMLGMKERFGYFVNFRVYAQYWTQVVGGIYFHSPTFTRQINSKSYMQSSAYRNLGEKASHGCIRLPVDDAMWIYYNCPAGTIVKITGKSYNGALRSKLKNKMRSFANYSWTKDTTPAVNYGTGTAIVTAELRTGVSGQEKTIGTLSKGSSVKILQMNSTWLKVKTGSGKIAYVRAASIKVNSKYTTRQGYRLQAQGQTRIYENDDINSDVIATMDARDWGTHVNTYGSFYKIRFEGKEGYVLSGKVKKFSAQVPRSATTSKIEYIGRVNTEGLRVRMLPSTNSDIMGLLDINDQVSIIKQNYVPGWHQINYGGNVAFVAAEYINITNDD